MELELRSNLMACAQAYASARGLELATIAQRAAGDWRFFDRLGDPTKTFTARKHDEVIHWFSKHWPADLDWPDGVPRPAAITEAA